MEELESGFGVARRRATILVSASIDCLELHSSIDGDVPDGSDLSWGCRLGHWWDAEW